MKEDNTAKRPRAKKSSKEKARTKKQKIVHKNIGLNISQDIPNEALLNENDILDLMECRVIERIFNSGLILEYTGCGCDVNKFREHMRETCYLPRYYDFEDLERQIKYILETISNGNAPTDENRSTLFKYPLCE